MFSACIVAKNAFKIICILLRNGKQLDAAPGSELSIFSQNSPCLFVEKYGPETKQER